MWCCTPAEQGRCLSTGILICHRTKHVFSCKADRQGGRARPILMVPRACCSDEYYAAQQACRWDKHIEDFANRDNENFNVGIMGLGEQDMQCCFLDAAFVLLFSAACCQRHPAALQGVLLRGW